MSATVVMRNTPYGSLADRPSAAGASRSAAMCGAAISAKRRPGSVRTGPAVILRTNDTPRSSSMRRMARPTLDFGTRSFLAAADSEPDSATSTSTPSSSRRTLWNLHEVSASGLANAAGRYAHPGDLRADVPLEPNFQGYADVHADGDGQFRILTVRPGVYPVDGLFQRSPHVHLDIRGHQRRLITQMYFEDTDATVLAQDQVLQHDMWGNTNPLPSTIFAKLQKARSSLDASATRYRFDIVL
jgi:hypothetical protein